MIFSERPATATGTRCRCRCCTVSAGLLLLHCRAVAAALQGCACTATPGASNVQTGCFHSHPSRNFVACVTVLCVYRSQSIEFHRFFSRSGVSCIMHYVPNAQGYHTRAAGEAPGTPGAPGVLSGRFFFKKSRFSHGTAG